MILRRETGSGDISQDGWLRSTHQPPTWNTPYPLLEEKENRPANGSRPPSDVGSPPITVQT
jgi:hypothetical protein